MNDLNLNNQDLLNCITRAHIDYPDLADRSTIFHEFLNDLLKLTDSEYGFIGEILHTKEQQPYTRMFAVSDIASVCFTILPRMIRKIALIRPILQPRRSPYTVVGAYWG